ncbi:AraC family transcriptional regulator [Flavobacteriaceae bacterium]|nr:AraC family transcriptional regulator [Flavobacteriaceae bacterium]MDB2314693.1 AraC family transcriptional regulator [Flavobacteriaceae bacterium]MDC3239046.1 AraC family transcriptional regulator [Flavobacteriaceae bacterium]
MYKPDFETISPDTGHSYKYAYFDKSSPNTHKVKWHYHPEVELVYINTGVGKRQVGTHLSNYQDGDLILIGSYLPHTGFTKGLEEGQKEIVIQFKPDIFEMAFQNLEELKRINQLLELSKKGIVFDGSIKEDIGIRMEGLQYETQIDAFLTFVKILHDLAKEKDKKILNAEGYAFISNPTENKRLKMIFNYIRDHFMEPIALEDISAQVFMTPQSFCRFFKKSTQKTFTNFLNEYRINHATKLLSETDVDIKTICYESGFNNLSNFFRNFKKITQLTPNAYRDEILGSTKNE